jgi:hypothetical protein
MTPGRRDGAAPAALTAPGRPPQECEARLGTCFYPALSAGAVATRETADPLKGSCSRGTCSNSVAPTAADCTGDFTPAQTRALCALGTFMPAPKLVYKQVCRQSRAPSRGVRHRSGPGV